MHLGFRAEYILLVSGFGSQARWKGSLPSIAWGVRELESPRANGTLCRDLLFPDIHSPGGLWPGGGAKKKKFSGLHTRFFFFSWRPPRPPRPAGRHSWRHTLRPCPLSSTPRTSCESLVHLDLCSISQTNLKSFQTGKRRNFK